MFAHFVVWLLLHRDDGFVPPRVEPLHAVILHFKLQNIVVMCNFFFNEDPSFEESVDDFLEATRCFRVKTSEFGRSSAQVIVFDVFNAALDFADTISAMPNRCFYRTICT